jgi:L-arabinose transport system ATP-binding protein
MKRFVEFKNINKAFVGVQALQDISFIASGGEVCALLGENGAGKSTLLKILSGDLKPDTGYCSINGEDVVFASPIEAIKKGVSVIYQERQLVNGLTVTENIFMEDLPAKKLGIIDIAIANREAQKIIDTFELPIKADYKVGDLSVAHQQMVEIMKAYRRDSQIIAFDEPTASLTDTEIDTLFKLINRIKKEGKVILYVSHRLKELFQISDKIVILKDGKFVTSVATKETNTKELICHMVGRDLGDIYNNLKRNDKYGDVVLEVKHLKNKNIDDVSFKLHRGEVLGFAGLVGAGRTETMRAIFGADPLESGEIYIEGKKVEIKKVRDAIRAGIGLCPEDRKEQGLILYRPIRDNITVSILKCVSRNGIINRKKEKAVTEDAVKKYSIKTHSIEKIVIELSGGNQQRVILGRWLSSEPKILILDEPTKGIDVGSKVEIYQMVCDLAKRGIGIIFISSELTEVINVCDNIIVMRDGKITGMLPREEVTEEKVLSLAMLKEEELGEYGKTKTN